MMAKIKKIDPKNWKKANVVQVDVDAANNSEAVDVLESWAAENGFARTEEYFLRIIMRADGTRVFRGICYRITREVKASAERLAKAAIKRARRIGGIERTSRKAG
jgi:hypothetical protein